MDFLKYKEKIDIILKKKPTKGKNFKLNDEYEEEPGLKN